ncbi:hypothetical protein [Bartonella sp. CB169]|uniref:hypothetical protein n=1 Tax=Bartonella sp. CB169 TaxID=3112257 RepID=UPI00300DFDAC
MKSDANIHHRTKLRHYIVEMLKAEDSLTDVQIFCNRTAPVHEKVLPCILLRSDSERMDEPYVLDNGGRSRTTTITIECRVAENAGDDVADKLAMIVEQAFLKIFVLVDWFLRANLYQQNLALACKENSQFMP